LRRAARVGRIRDDGDMEPEPLPPAAAARLLRASAAEIATEIRALPVGLSGRRPAGGGWCALEVLGHLLEAERRGFAGRIRLLIAEDQPRLETWDQPSVAASRHDCERDAEALVREFLDLREEGAILLEALMPADLTRGGEHPTVGWLTVGDVMHEWVHHDRAHLEQVLELSQTFVWPHMGRARGFSG
jgi:hypothetical protein